MSDFIALSIIFGLLILEELGNMKTKEFKSHEYNFGYEMCRAGRTVRDNPYHPVIEENKWNQYNRGWRDAFKEHNPTPADKNAKTYTTAEIVAMEAEKQK